MSKRVIITGANGQLGQSIVKISNQYPDFDFYPLGNSDCDITDGHQVRKVVHDIRPDYLINAAAFTMVDHAEKESDQAMAVNAYALQNIGQSMEGKKVIHISTDYVYHLEEKIPYKEEMEMNPQSVYAQSKAMGEFIIRRTSCNSIIIRTSWVYSEFGNNFVKTMLKLAQSMDEIKVVDDQWGSPTYATDLSRVVLETLSIDARGAVGMEVWNQTFNYANGGIISWFTFASEIMKMAGLATKIIPIPTALFPRPASRPPWGAMDTSKIESKLRCEIIDWKVSLEKCIDNLIN